VTWLVYTLTAGWAVGATAAAWRFFRWAEELADAWETEHAARLSERARTETCPCGRHAPSGLCSQCAEGGS
jgi:hypothetical protein